MSSHIMSSQTTVIPSSTSFKPMITRMDSSPPRRRVLMTPTPFMLAATQYSSIGNEESDAYSTINGSTTTNASNRVAPAVRSPTKSIVSVKSLQSVKSVQSANNSSPSRSNVSPKRPSNDHIMTDNVIYSTNSNPIARRSSRRLRDSVDNSDNPSEEKQCNKYGFFVGSNEAQVLPDLTNNDLQLIRKREKKWLYMLQHWDQYITKRWKKVRDRCRKGIPHSMRGQAWLHLCGAQHQMKHNPLVFDELLNKPGDEQIVDEIRKDIHRQFPSHEMFSKRNGSGQMDLFRVLKAFSILKPDIGYCQGQAPIASVLLMHMPAEHAFWSLVTICDHYLPGYYSPGLETLQLHGDMLFAFLKKFSPHSYKLLKEQNIEPILYMTEWFMCIYARTLPWTTVLRVWDMFLCEGIKVVFKVAIALISTTLRDETKKTCPSMYETLEKLRNINFRHLTETVLIEHMFKIELHDRDLQHEHNIQEKKRRKAKQQTKSKTK